MGRIVRKSTKKSSKGKLYFGYTCIIAGICLVPFFVETLRLELVLLSCACVVAGVLLLKGAKRRQEELDKAEADKNEMDTMHISLASDRHDPPTGQTPASEDKESEAKMPQVPNPEHDPYLERWNNRKAPKIVDLEMPDLPFQSRFDFSHIRGYDFGMEGNPIPFFIDGKNRDIATEDILSLNPFLRQAHDQDRKVPVFAFSADKIRFDSKEPETDDLTMLSTRPLTKTGKLPKYPLMMKIRTLSNDESWNMQTAEGSGGKELFGEIYYLQTGEIGKARIICWRHVRKKEYATSECYTFNIKRNKEGLYLAE